MTTKFLTIKCAKSPNFPNFIVMEIPRKNSILTEFAFWRGLGRGKLTEIVQNTVFPGKFHDNKIWKILRILLSEILLSFGRLLNLEGKFAGIF